MGAGQLFPELVWLQFRGKQKERNEEVGIPRAEILDMPWDSAKEQNWRGGGLQQGHTRSVLRDSAVSWSTRWGHREGLSTHLAPQLLLSDRGKPASHALECCLGRSPGKTQSRQIFFFFLIYTTEPFLQVNHVTAASKARRRSCPQLRLGLQLFPDSLSIQRPRAESQIGSHHILKD